MSQQGVQLDGRRFCCSICLDLLKEPVTTTCGHSYCMSCIRKHWDDEDQRRIYSCPQCRHSFIPRPVLLKNTMLADLVEELRKTTQQTSLADYCYARPGDVACDSCTGTKLKATKSCLNCRASYCALHLQSHYQYPTFQNHQLVEAAPERPERQREVRERWQQIQQRIQDRQKELRVLQQEVEAINHSADKAVRDNQDIFTQLLQLMEKKSFDVKKQIRSQQETEVSRVKELQEKLEQEITELRRKATELEQLSHTEDHVQLLHRYPSLSPLSGSTNSSSSNIRHLNYFEDVTAAVSHLRDKLQQVLSEEWTKTSLTETEMDVLQTAEEPKTRTEFLQYSRQITLDSNTANTQLLLSQENRKVRSVGYSEKQPYPHHPDRFTDHPQVLSKESLTGRCYWEVELSGNGVSVAVAYKNINRTGYESEFKDNDKSWLLHCHNLYYNFNHNSISTLLSGPQSSRVGVYLDHRAGILSFYSVSETMTLIHKVQTTFTQPLHAGLSVCPFLGVSTARLC
ncbi:hypothetical protein PAMP_000231 [Pampus punctatissimus]